MPIDIERLDIVSSEFFIVYAGDKKKIPQSAKKSPRSGKRFPDVGGIITLRYIIYVGESFRLSGRLLAFCGSFLIIYMPKIRY